MKHSRALWRALAITGFVLGVVVVAGTAYLRRQVFPDICANHTTFSTAEWMRLADPPAGGPDRACIVDDLLSRQLLRGRTRLEVNALLGPPAPGEKPDAGYEAIYYLGPERGPFGIDSQWLQLAFDSTGRVSRADLHTD